MITSKEINTFKLSVVDGHSVITTQECPWGVFQMVPTTPQNFDNTLKLLEKHWLVAIHDTDRTFCIICIGSGGQGEKHPECHVTITITGSNYNGCLDALKDSMGQAAVWYYTNVMAVA